MSENRHNNDFRIYEGINVDLLYGSGIQLFTYHSYDGYLAKMSSPYTYKGQLEITAVSAFYGKEVHVRFDETALPAATFATTDDVHLRYTAMSRHYDTFQQIIRPCRTTPRLDLRWWPIFCVTMTHHPTAKEIVNAWQNFAVANRVFS